MNFEHGSGIDDSEITGSFFKLFIERIKCRFFRDHENRFVQNFYGDQIRYNAWKRSEWVCKLCGKKQYSNRLCKDGVN